MAATETRPAFAPAIMALDAEIRESADDLVGMVLNDECSFAFAIRWAERALTGDQRDGYINYLRTF